MLVYYGLILIIGLLYLLIERLNINDKRKKFMFISFVMTVILQGLRSSEVGIDLKQYIYAFNVSKNVSWTTPILNFEIGFRILLHLLSVLCGSEQIFIFVTSTICQAPIFYFIYKKSTSPFESLLIYLTFGMFTFSFSGMRQTLAMGLFLIAVILADEQKWREFLLLVALASTIHTSALFGLIAYPLSKIRIKRSGELLLLGLFGIEMLFGQQITELAVTLYGRTFQTSQTGAYGLFIFYVIVWILCVLFLEKEQPWILFGNFCMMSALCQGLGAFHPSIARIGYYFSIFMCVLIPHIIDRSTNNYLLKVLLHVGLCVFCIAFFQKNTGNGYLNVCPYIPFWR